VSGRLSRYLNQTAIWKKKTGTLNGYGKPERVEAPLKCRIEKRIRLVKDQFGKEVVSDSTIYTEAAVTADDAVDGRPVLAVTDMVDVAGKIIGYEVYL